MSAVHAIEQLAEVEVGPEIAQLRRLLYAGEWISSHALHMFMLHAPDFLGYQDGVSMARDHRDLVRDGLRIKKAGNSIVQCLGGREIHPINVKLGGFYRLPVAQELQDLLPELTDSRDTMLEIAALFGTFEFPEFERDYEFVALREDHSYPFNRGRIVSNKGLDIDVTEYEAHFEERQVPHSTALHSSISDRGSYLCGPLARFNLNADRLRPAALDAADRCGLTAPCHNPFKSLLARAIETVQALDEAIEIIREYRAPSAPAVEVATAKGRGCACTEAPRGILFHRYDVTAHGNVEQAKIVPPTSQNQATIESDLFELAKELAKLPHEAATWRAEQAVRNYDPCISCSTHFIRLKIEHG
jgi:coenzyme F420-reducing hydrogenase alpha subunit